MSRIVSLNLSDKLIKKIEELSQEKNVSKSQLANTLLELSFQKQQAIELAQDTKLDKLKLELGTKLDNLKDDFNGKLNQTKNELSLDFSYKLEKLQDQLDEIQSKLSELDKLSFAVDELMYHSIFAKKAITTFAYIAKAFTTKEINTLKAKTQEAIEEYKKLKGGEA